MLSTILGGNGYQQCFFPLTYFETIINNAKLQPFHLFIIEIVLAQDEGYLKVRAKEPGAHPTTSDQ